MSVLIEQFKFSFPFWCFWRLFCQFRLRSHTYRRHDLSPLLCFPAPTGRPGDLLRGVLPSDRVQTARQAKRQLLPGVPRAADGARPPPVTTLRTPANTPSGV